MASLPHRLAFGFVITEVQHWLSNSPAEEEDLPLNKYPPGMRTERRDLPFLGVSAKESKHAGTYNWPTRSFSSLPCTDFFNGISQWHDGMPPVLR